MRALAFCLLLFGGVSLMAGTATLTADFRPPEWANWGWSISGRVIELNRYAVWWHDHTADGGFWTTTIMLPPALPRIQREFMSKEARELQKRDDRLSPAYQAEWTRLNDLDRKKFWTWPDWHGMMVPARTSS